MITYHSSAGDNCFSINGSSEDRIETYQYTFRCSEFSIGLSYDDKEVMQVNPISSLYIETGGQLTPAGTPSESGVIDELGFPMLVNFDYQTSVALGFFFPTEHIYGIPGREFDFDLKTTEKSGPYRLFNRDLDPHWPRNRTELYGSIPYITGHSTDSDGSVAWLNSADTWVEMLSHEVDGKKGSYINFLSEGGMLEFFMFGSGLHPGRVQKSLAQATGFLALPPLQTLGF